MKIYNVTMRIHENMAVYKNNPDKRPLFSVASSKIEGASTNETNVKFNVHTGTHVDFPRHIHNDGVTSVNFDPATFLRPVFVADLTDVKEKITARDLQKYNFQAGDFILLKTSNSNVDEFLFNFVYLSEDGAKYLAERGVSGIGIDALGIERDQKGHPSHHILMANDIWIIEGLRLFEVSEGYYEMIALPLLLEGVDALPLTILLRK